jgi:hypothetical protein
MNQTSSFLIIAILAICCITSGCLLSRNPGETTLETTGTAIPIQTGTPVANGHSGAGNMSLQMPLNYGVYLVQVQNNGTGLFSVELSNEDFYQLVIRSSGNVQATQAAGIPESGMFWLNVTSDGTWDITLGRPEANVPSSPPLDFSGAGDSASGFITLPAKTTSFAMKNNGTGIFAVWLYNETGGFVFDPTGTYVQPLPNHVGDYNGTVDVEIPRAGHYVINVMSDGPWSVEVSMGS